MKRKWMRVLSLILVLTMVFSLSPSALAVGGRGSGNSARWNETENVDEHNAPDDDSQDAEEPTPEPTEEPTPAPTEEPTPEPTEEPTPEPTEEPTPEPTEEPTPEPTEEPTPEPTEEPTPAPTEEPTPAPTEEPTPEPTEEPEEEPVVNAIVTQPADFRALVNEQATFFVETTGEVSHCQWQYSANGRFWNNLSAFYYGNTNELTMKVTRRDNNTLFRCVVYFADGQQLVSESAKLTVVSGYFETEPQSVTVAPGEQAEFSVTVKGTVYKYEWQSKAPEAGKWTAMSGRAFRNVSAIKVDADEKASGTQYRCVVTLRDGTRLTSEAAVLTVEKPITYEARILEPVTAVEGVTLSVDAPEGALPSNAVMNAETADVSDYADDIAALVGENANIALALDISFTAPDKGEIEPEEDVIVYLTVPGLSELEGFQVIHISDEGEVKKLDTVSEEDLTRELAEDEIAVKTDEFSKFVVAEAVVLKNDFITDNGLTCTVTVTFTKEAGIPDNAKLSVTETSNNADTSEEAAARNAQLAEVLYDRYGNVLIADVRYLNITIMVDDEPFEALADPVSVTISYSQPLQTEIPMNDVDYSDGQTPPEMQDSQVVIVHYVDEDTTEILDADVTETDGLVTETTFTTDGFSSYDVVTIIPYTVPEAGMSFVRAAAGDGELSPLDSRKDLTYNNDGTYTLSLSVTGDAHSETHTETQTANVIIVFDRSSSMVNNNVPMADGGYVWTGDRNQYQLYRDRNTSRPVQDGQTYNTMYYRTSNYSQWQTYNSNQVRVSQNIRRADAAEKAVYDMVQTRANGGLQDGNIQFAFIDFNSGSSARTFGSPTNYWTTNPSVDFAGFLSSTGAANSAANSNYASGTNWPSALNTTLDTVLASADSDPTYVLFITDGRPWISNSDSNAENIYNRCRGTARNIEIYNTATHTSVTDGTDNTTFYGIYAFGSEADYLDDLVAYAMTGTERGAGSGTNTTGLDGRYFKANDASALNEAIQSISSAITNSLNYGGVDYTDSIATDTTNTTLSTSVDGAVTGLTYTVKNGSTTVYTVTTDGSKVYFDLGDGVKHEASSDQVTINGKTGTYYYYTSGTGDDAVTYKMALADLEDGKDINWDLTAIGGLLGGYTYTLSFTVWPVQGAYDAVADLNNGLLEWDTSLSTYQDLRDTKGYEIGGVEGFTNIVRYSNGTYAVLTNTSQEVEYYIVDTVTDDQGEHTTYAGPYTTTPTLPPPMQLVSSNFYMEKEWLVSLSPGELQEWIDKGNYVTLRVTIDNDQYLDYRFPTENEADMTVIEDEHGNVIWQQSCSIAPGIMLLESKAIEEGINPDNYGSVTMGGKTYVVLGYGHDYTVEEIEGSDLHFEFSTEYYHPMLVDGVLKSVRFSADRTTAEVVMENLTSLRGTNTLKGGISIYKEVYEEDMTTKVEDCTDVFAFEVIMWIEDAQGHKTPVYTTPDQFDDDGKPSSGSFGYRVYEGKGDDRQTIQRDAIYAGTSPAQVTVGSEVTTMVFSMQANQYCFIVNVPAGTKYTVRELTTDNYHPFYDSVSVLDGDSTTDEYIIVTENTVSGNETVLPVAKQTVAGYVSANSSSEVHYHNWAASFYVYHSSNNAIERISFADPRVTVTFEDGAYKYAFNIVNETGRSSASSPIYAESAENVNDDTYYSFTGGFLYGGYYSAYGGTTLTAEGIYGLTYTDGFASDSGGTPYDGSSLKVGDAKFWVRTNAKKVLRQGTAVTGETGTELHPQANDIYFLKEVPVVYLTNRIQYVYDWSNNYEIEKLFLITAIDDSLYQQVGFDVVVKTYKANVCTKYTFTQRGSTPQTETITATSTYFNGVSRGYLGVYADPADIQIKAGTEFSVTPNWLTLDGVNVYGTLQGYKFNTNQKGGLVKNP